MGIGSDKFILLPVCDPSCDGCTAGTSSDCDACAAGYYDNSGTCDGKQWHFLADSLADMHVNHINLCIIF